jgi:hypothetical protein
VIRENLLNNIPLMYLLLLYTSNYPAWISGSKHISRNIAGYNAPRSYYAAITNCYARANNNTPPHPYIFTDNDGFGKLQARSSLFIIDGMGGWRSRCFFSGL